MMDAKKKQRGLGRGLSALISTPVQLRAVNVAEDLYSQSLNTEASSAQIASPKENFETPVPEKQEDGSQSPDLGIKYVPLSALCPNPKQPRKDFSAQELQELTESIKSKGVLQPILVRPYEGVDAKASYEVVAGERRYRAATLAGLESVPVVVRSFDDRETLEIAIIENVQRKDLTPIEEARAYERLSVEFNLSQSEIAEKVGKDRVSISNLTRLLKLPEEVQQLIASGALTVGHAKAILTVREPGAQSSLARKVIKDGLTVRDLEAIVSRVVVLDSGKRIKAKIGSGDKQSLPLENGINSASTVDAQTFQSIVDNMRRALGTKVTLKHHESGRGRIEIEYFSEEELSRIADYICQPS